MSCLYPKIDADRDRWVAKHRPSRNSLDPYKPYAFLTEDECGADYLVRRMATIFLTNRECPWRCVMCDLWRNTLTDSVPEGAIPIQIEYALARLGDARGVKLYNAGSFFDRRAIPIADHRSIAAVVSRFERVIVESHPALIGDECFKFGAMLTGKLEVAMGLETVHRDILQKLNKRMTLTQFSEAAERLRLNNVQVRAFVLVKPPFMELDEVSEWAARSIEFAFGCGAEAVSLIPTRGGNGAMEELSQSGDFASPSLAMLEEAASYGLGLKRGRVFADLWDLERFRTCASCFEARSARLRQMNLGQRVLPRIACCECGGGN